MQKKSILIALLIAMAGLSQAQPATELKRYTNVIGGEAEMIYNWGEFTGSSSSKVFTIVQRSGSGYYYLKVMANRQAGEKLYVIVNGTEIGTIYPETTGWQTLGKSFPAIKLMSGKNEIRFLGNEMAVPMVEEISLTRNNPWRRATEAPDAADKFIEQAKALQRLPAANFQTVEEAGDLTTKVLPNPAGAYDHYVDTTFTYTHFSWIYLNTGSHNFSTSGSTINRALTIFNPSNYTYSWSNVNGGPGGESALNLYVGLAGYYAIMLRPVTDGQTGSTNIIYNGNTLVSNAIIGGRRLAMSTLKGGPMNHFTCKLTGAGADTRMIASWYAMSSVRGYNDDYSGGGGDWNWGLASRIKKDFSGSDSVQYAFVCAYSPSTNGICDMYAGTRNSGLHDLEPQNFPLLKNDDAIETAPWNGTYNCISWSGGITTSWTWPPSSLSTYNCNSANYLQCFDNFYSNNPVRYPGAWNYTRTGATAANSVVDLWKTASAYTHASVRKPGNNHPHGYDWESKPGSTWRTLHPRYALEQANWYGFVTNYYRPTGTYARNAVTQYSFETDMDAIKAGVAVYDKGVLTQKATEKLYSLNQKVSLTIKSRFEELYKAWDATKAANSSMSDPSMYCQNKEYKEMEKLAMMHPKQVMVLVFDKFVNGNDHLIGDLLVSLTKEKYGRLLDDVKAERLAKPNDEQGRHKIHGDHDNGVLYIEKILRDFELDEIVAVVAETVNITVSPNPVRDVLQIKLLLKQSSDVTVTITSTQTLKSRLVQQTTMLAAGLHQFNVPVASLSGTTGDVLSVQVRINDELKSVKVLVNK